MSTQPECLDCGDYVNHGDVICQDCLTQHDAAIIRKSREKLLDKIMLYMANHGVEKRPEGYYVVSGTFSLGGFIKYMESLRAQQVGEP